LAISVPIVNTAVLFMRHFNFPTRTRIFLALLLPLGFFSALGFMMAHGLSKDTAGSEALLTMLGSLGTGFTMVLAYYFGSSAGSEVKNTDHRGDDPRSQNLSALGHKLIKGIPLAGEM
jgi:spore maturation protein SpmB